MDDLSFRKAVYANPFTTDPEVVRAAQNDTNKQAFWDELKVMETELNAAMQIPVPENLAERLILRQSLSDHKTKRKQRPWYIALAASVALATILSVGMLSGGNDKLTNDVYAHMSHMEAELMKSPAVDLNAVNAKLASFNGHINNEAQGKLGEIVSANYCYLDKIKSLHMIIRGENGLTSLFVVPEAISQNMAETFSNATYEGASFLLESAKIIVVGESPADVKTLKQQAQAALSFSA